MEQIFVGNKDISRYITACLSALQKGGEKKVKISARGRYIKKAVDIEEIVKRYMKNPVALVTLGSQRVNDRFVSTIDIILAESD